MSLIAISSDPSKSIARQASFITFTSKSKLTPSIADKITVLHFGKIISEGDKHSIQSDPLVQKAYLGDQC